MMRTVRFATLLISVALIGGTATLGWEFYRVVRPSPGPIELAAMVMETPGIGIGGDVLQPRASVREHPMAIALYASAHTAIADEQAVKDAADRLVELAAENDSFGWGLGFRWDAFADGSVNPGDTVYGITTALAVRALLDAHQVLEDAAYLTAAQRALDGYAAYFTATPDGGYFWYSDQVTDAAPVANVSSMLAGQYARASALLARDDYANLAERAGRYLVGHAERNEEGRVSWPYGIDRIGFNDAIHAGYLVEGLILVDRYVGLDGFDQEASLAWLREFVVAGERVTRFIGSVEADRSWGVGQLLHVFCTYTNDADTVSALRRAIEDYEYAPGHYGPHPGVEVLYPRFQAHVLLGLASCEARGMGDD